MVRDKNVFILDEKFSEWLKAVRDVEGVIEQLKFGLGGEDISVDIGAGMMLLIR